MDLSARTFHPETATREEWGCFHEYAGARHREAGLPGDPPPEAAREDILRGSPWTIRTLESDGRIVSVVYFRERPGELRMAGAVLEGFRRRGIGTSWLREALGRMERAGLPRLWAQSSEADGQEFLELVGFAREKVDRGSRLRLEDVDWEMVRAWEAGLARTAPGVVLTLHEDRVPDDLIDGYVALRCAFPDTGDVGETAEEMRALLARYTGPDGSHHTILATEPDGTLSGMTEVFWRPDRPESVHQHFTGVLPAHTGRGVGKALKASMLRFLRNRYPDLRHVATSNATTRGPILRINERLGFEETISAVTYGISRAALAEWLGEG